MPASSATTVGLIIVAAGSGSRLGAEVPKAFVPLAGTPILGHALRGALACPDIAEVVVVAPRAWLGEADVVCRWARSRVPVTVVPGGVHRTGSVAAGLDALAESHDIVLVHDAARCLTPAGVFERVIAAVRGGAGAVVPGIAVVDTIKVVDGDGFVVATPERASLRSVQTPQGFRRQVLERAHAAATSLADAGGATDDAGLVERLGAPVLVVDGDALALKVTTAPDLASAERILGA